jgi:hypothetical protein
VGDYPLQETVGHRRCGAHSPRFYCGHRFHRYGRCFSNGHRMCMGSHAATVALEALPHEPGTRGELRRPRFSVGQGEDRKPALTLCGAEPFRVGEPSPLVSGAPLHRRRYQPPGLLPQTIDSNRSRLVLQPSKWAHRPGSIYSAEIWAGNAEPVPRTTSLPHLWEEETPSGLSLKDESVHWRRTHLGDSRPPAEAPMAASSL